MLSSSMQDRSSEPPGLLSFAPKGAHAANHGQHQGYPQSSPENASHDSFSDSLAEMQEEAKNSDVLPDLSAFLSQEEINKSLDLAREAIAHSETEDVESEQEITHILNPSPQSPSGSISSGETRRSEEAASKRPGPVRPESSAPGLGVGSRSELKRQPVVSPLLMASPSYIRSLRSAERRGANAQSPSASSKPTSQGEVGSRSKLCDKAANFIEELSSIFREAAKPRNRSPDGESSSPDSGYLSPKNQPSTPMSALASQSPTTDHQEMEVGAKSADTAHLDAFCGENRPLFQSDNCTFHQQPGPSSSLPTAPRFTQKLRSQEVAEGSRVLLECRVTGHPKPRIRLRKMSAARVLF
uniref:Palladin, cytoskeletal associated protein n=1 Tax=Ornithorhynchus anatinus TaxID=9258 RepID=F6WVP4_ORNAN